jgi:hypothetical protein
MGYTPLLPKDIKESTLLRLLVWKPLVQLQYYLEVVSPGQMEGIS